MTPTTHLSDNARRVNQEQPPQRNALVLEQHPIVLAQAMILVAQQRDVDLSQSAILPARVRPGQETVLAIGAREDDAGTSRCEVGGALAERYDLGRAHEGPGHGDEAED
jgi:hypothetical protein